MLSNSLVADQRLDWWQEARFGMMIHWGLYSVPAGKWDEQYMEYIGEWIMSRFRIPIEEYEKLAASFSPEGFDAERWVLAAKRAGMRYLIYTAKHHDGFAMYRSGVDPYNIADATPFGRDALAELAEACAKHGMKLCLYYSQSLDWHERDAADPQVPKNNGMSWGNDWDFPDRGAKRFERYFEKKVKPQLTELLTGYGPIHIVWFDTPFEITRAQCEELYALVRSLQPDCIMNSRLGNGLGDYGSLGDNEVPAGVLDGYWEVPATLNDTWGYKAQDTLWKSAADVVGLLTSLAGKGCNYVLNIGPRADGRFPEASEHVLEEIGDWMAVHGEAVHGTLHTPFAHDLAWGPVTTKPGRLYLHLHRWPDDDAIALNGLRSAIHRAYLLSRPEESCAFEQEESAVLGRYTASIRLPARRERELLPVLALELAAGPDVVPGLIQQADGTVLLPANRAELHLCAGAGSGATRGEGRIATDGAVTAAAEPPSVTKVGVVKNWYSELDWLSWTFEAYESGAYEVQVTTSGLYHKNAWKGGHRIRVAVGEQETRAEIRQDETVTNAATHYYRQAVSRCGSIRLDRTGRHQLRLTADEIKFNDHIGLALVQVRLVPVENSSVVS
ncbi:alpha-L-fucosidase [Cohnella sp. JJ-181]|uniref:alpha-L-fucosidase n=1 Tax=Cohnella rhizoplanae TaxID=2974897 RepID=UPI0022FF71E6|nr:alpha-L-fucosidase [Cohnella sp. JJ-181]CAI6083705.1 hypothetical protein COHCIP112018_04084 [Cohnella sp. JJ-181]